MRLFFALPFDAGARAAFGRVQQDLARRAAGGKFPPAENFHLTLAFLGEVDAGRLGGLQTLLRENPVPPLDLLFDRVGQFQGGIWYLAPRTSPPLLSGQAALAAALRRVGFPLEERPYRPHLTLGRKVTFPAGENPPDLPKEPIPARSSGAVLFHSHRVEGRLQYTPLTENTRFR